MSRMKSWGRYSLCLCASVLIFSSAYAQPAPKIGAVYPQGGQRGTTATVTFYGESLDTGTGLIFSGDPGLTATVTPQSGPLLDLVFSAGGIAAKGKDQRPLKAQIVIDKDATLGSREVRVVTPNGVSNSLRFYVGDLPEIMEDESGDTDAKAQTVTPPITITGRINPSANEDHYRFHAIKGQRLICDVQGARIGSALDGTLTLTDAQGKEVAQNEDAEGVDPVIDYTVPEEGDYILKLRDVRYQGGPNYTYRLSVGALPYLDSIYPFGAQRGQDVDITLKGRNLDGAMTSKLTIAPDAPLGRQDIRAHTSVGFSNPRPFEIGDLPEMSEQEPNNTPEKANVINLPVTINGRLDAEKDMDVFKFKLDAPTVIIFEVEARRFGSPLDAVLTLTDAKGNVRSRNDDDLGVDARIISPGNLEPGEYYLSLRDLLDHGGESYGYRLKAMVPPPDFRATFFPDTPRIHRGSCVPVRVEIERLGGFGGAVEIGFEDLPKGIGGKSVLLVPDAPPATYLMLAASPDAAKGAFPLKLTARGSVGGKQIAHSAQPLYVERPLRAPDPNRPPDDPDPGVREAFLSVLDSAPFSLEMISLNAQTMQDDSTVIEVAAKRKEGFAGAIELSAQGYSSGRSPISSNVETDSVRIGADKSRATIRLKARSEAETGTRLIYASGTAKVDGESVTQYTSAIPLTIAPAPFALSSAPSKLSLTALPPGTQSAAGEAVFAIKASRHGWFDEDVALAAEGLPEGVQATTAVLSKGAGEATLKLTANDKAPTGKEISFVVVGTAEVNGQRYARRTAPITLTVDKPAETAAKIAP